MVRVAYFNRNRSQKREHSNGLRVCTNAQQAEQSLILHCECRRNEGNVYSGFWSSRNDTASANEEATQKYIVCIVILPVILYVFFCGDSHFVWRI